MDRFQSWARLDHGADWPDGGQPDLALAPPGRPLLSVVAPCFNEAECLDELHRRVTAACVEVVGEAYELVLINDGSTDRTRQKMAELVLRDSHVVVVELSRNHGHQLALTAGLSICRGERILIVDADLQDPPELLGRMMAALDHGADVVYGQRLSRAGEGRWKTASAKLFYQLLRRMADIDIPADTGDFRLMSRRVLDAFLAMPEQHRFVRGMVSWLGFRQVALPYERAERFAGTTKYPLRRMLRLATDAVTGFSTRPLRLANYLSVLLASFFLIALGYTAYVWFMGATVPGWTSVMTVVLLLGCFQMLVLAIMCAYLGRLFVETKRRPLFLIDRILRGAELATPVAEGRNRPQGARARPAGPPEPVLAGGEAPLARAADVFTGRM